MIKYCLHCGKSSESDIEMKFCPNCGTPYEHVPHAESQTQQPPPETPPPSMPPPQMSSPAPETKYVPWEDRGKEGFLGSLYETWKQSCFYPAEFYRKMPLKGGIWNPLFYSLIMAFIGMVFQMIYSQIFSDLFDPTAWFPMADRSFNSDWLDFSQKLRSMSNLANVVILPFAVTVGLFIWSGILHLILIIFGWNKENYESSFRLVAYSDGPSFFKIIPIVGDIVSVVWQVVLVIIGIREVHKTTTGKAVLVVLLPLLAFCLCCCGIIFWIIGLAGLTR